MAPLDTYVSYVIVDEEDEFLVGLAMLEFERTGMPELIKVIELKNDDVAFRTTYSRAATLGGEEEILALFPPGVIQRVVTL